MKTEQTQLAIIDPKEFGLEEKQAEKMTSGLTVVIEERKALEQIYSEILVKVAENDRLNKIEADKQAKIQADLKAENDRIAKELNDKKLKEEKELAEQKARIESEEADRLAKEKAALLAPDKDKINALYLAIKNISFPELETEEAKAIVESVKSGFDIILQVIKDAAKTLK